VVRYFIIQEVFDDDFFIRRNLEVQNNVNLAQIKRPESGEMMKLEWMVENIHTKRRR